MLSLACIALERIFGLLPDQVAEQYPNKPRDAVYGNRDVPAGHLYFSWLKNGDGKGSAGHYEILARGNPGTNHDIALPEVAPHVLDCGNYRSDRQMEQDVLAASANSEDCV